ncbi:MAG: altronate dehydratase family protein [Hyphomicrobiales bacterium]
MTPHTPETICLHETDNVVIALRNIAADELLNGHNWTANAPVMRGHKIATAAIAEGENVIRYGQIIGQTKQDIAIGDHIHTHNLEMGDHKQDYAFGQDYKALAAAKNERTFMGYQRADGGVGTRNYLAIITTVNCSATVAKLLAEAAEKDGLLEEFPNIDGIVPIVHGTGCGMSATDESYDTLFRTISGYAQHPNFAGVLLLGLGCEVMQVSNLMGERTVRSDGNYRYMTIQQMGGTRRTIERGLEQLREIAALANKAERVATPISEIMVGMQCGGSDGYSGITANPALGYASDLLVSHGGTTILSETTEIYGAEHLLTRRAVSEDVGQKIVSHIEWWEDYCARNGGEMNNNPSPGNKRGGLTTILEKSLGATAKSGTAPLTEVYKFAEKITKHGFVFMDSPGYDPVSVTGQIASGANMVIFTTGRGSVSGFKPAPTIKIATNSEMYERMSEDMDINCGDIISDGASIEDKGHEIFEMLIKCASGELSKSEELGFGGAEFVPWQQSATM